jgi:hypothetical protein
MGGSLLIYLCCGSIIHQLREFAAIKQHGEQTMPALLPTPIFNGNSTAAGPGSRPNLLDRPRRQSQPADIA